MECCIGTIMRHVSIRKFAPGDIPESDIEVILRSAQRAPSSWGLQPVTIIVVRDSNLKRELADIVGGQEHVARAPVLFVFSVDYHKLRLASERLGVEFSRPGWGHLSVAIVDVGIASGWAALAAESLGYGAVFVALYSNPCRVAELLKLPELVLPIAGLAVGKPAEKPRLRPRQPLEVFAGVNSYPEAGDRAGELLAGLFGDKTWRLYSHVLSPGSYYDMVTRRLVECARARGFNV